MLRLQRVYIYWRESVESANPRKQAPRLQRIRDEVIIRSLRDRIAPYPSILTTQRILLAPPQITFSRHAGPTCHWVEERSRTKTKLCSSVVIQPETSSLMSEQANQLHNPPVMFNETKITFYTFLHSCDKHAVFFVCGSHYDFNHNRFMWLWW